MVLGVDILVLGGWFRDGWVYTWDGMVWYPGLGWRLGLMSTYLSLWEGKTDERLHFIGGRSIPLDIYTDWKGVLA